MPFRYRVYGRSLGDFCMLRSTGLSTQQAWGTEVHARVGPQVAVCGQLELAGLFSASRPGTHAASLVAFGDRAVVQYNCALQRFSTSRAHILHGAVYLSFQVGLASHLMQGPRGAAARATAALSTAPRWLPSRLTAYIIRLVAPSGVVLRVLDPPYAPRSWPRGGAHAYLPAEDRLRENLSSLLCFIHT